MRARAALLAATLLAIPALNLPVDSGAASAPRIAAPPKEAEPREIRTIGRPDTTEQIRADAGAATAQIAEEVKAGDIKPDRDEAPAIGNDNGATAADAAGAYGATETADNAAAANAVATDAEATGALATNGSVLATGLNVDEPAPLIMRDPAGPDTVAREIVFLSRASDTELDALIAENRFNLIGRDRLASLGLVMVTARLPAGVRREATLAALARDARVAWAQPNHIYWLLSGDEAAASSRDRGLAMHGLAKRRVNVGGTIALIDGPVDAGNTALAGARISEELFGEDGTPSPHGTAIAEILVGTGNFRGVAQGARLLSLSAFRPVGTDGWQSTTRHVARALDRAVAARPQVLNLSFGTRKIDRTARELLDLLEAQGTCVAAAAGNGGGAVLFPGLLDQTVAVTAVDGSRALYQYASRGPEVDVAAWGVTMSAAVPGGRRTVSGTSFATAVVAGSMMHMPACNGAANPGAMRRAVRSDALDLGASGPDALFGAGLFNLGAASRVEVPVASVPADEASEAAETPASGEGGSSALLWALPLALLGLLVIFVLWRRRQAEKSPPG